MNSFLYKYRAVGATWGLWVRVHYHWTPNMPAELLLPNSCDARLAAELQQGLYKRGRLPGRLEIVRLEFNPTDFQPEALRLAGIGLAAELMGLEPNYPELRFEQSTNAYVLES